jgi:hypothetical protein
MAGEAPQVRYAALPTPAGCATSCACAALRPPCGAQSAERWTLWVKRTDVEGARYAEIESLASSLTVSKLIARWVSEVKLDVRPSLVTLRLVKRGPGVPTASEEADSTLLVDPSATLRGAGVADGSWLLADFGKGYELTAFSLTLGSPARRPLRKLLQQPAVCVSHHVAGVGEAWEQLLVLVGFHLCPRLVQKEDLGREVAGGDGEPALHADDVP